MRSQQNLGVHTVLATHLNAENIDINNQNIETDLLIAIPQFVRPETTAKIPQGLEEVVNEDSD